MKDSLVYEKALKVLDLYAEDLKNLDEYNNAEVYSSIRR